MLAWMLGAPGATVVKAGYGVYYSAFEGLSAGIMSGNPPYGFTDTSAAPTLFNEPFVTAATGVSVGQRFPLQPVAFGASQAHPNTQRELGELRAADGDSGVCEEQCDAVCGELQRCRWSGRWARIRW